MMRWLGGLTGGALAVSAIVLLVGIPSIVAPVVTEPVSQASAPAPAAATMPMPEPEPVATMQPLERPASPPAAAPVEPAQHDPEPAPDETIEALRWHAFWSPFRSQIAAHGFVSQLQTVTALDYRVVTVKPGVYEVAFGYHDDADIARNLAQIAAATGLDVPES